LNDHTEAQVLSTILGSTEFYGRAQTLSGSGTQDERFVKALYQLLLKRSASSAELAGWGNVLPQLSRAGVALDFLNSVEYRPALFSSYYQSLLHRPADPVGLSTWINTTTDPLAVRLGLESSPEYFTFG